jgi:hypothetical protein
MTLTNDNTFPSLQYITAGNIHSPGVTAVFSTRNGGVSGMTPETEHLRSLNLQSGAEGEVYANTVENCRIIASSQGFRPEDIISVRQRHTDRIITVDDSIAGKYPRYTFHEEADALITDMTGVLLSVRTADCVPVLLYDGKSKAIGAVHSGWRGTFARIGAKTVRRMTEQYGTNPANLQAAIGPAIGVCCYEVGDEVCEQFRAEHGDSIGKYFPAEPGKKPYCDLKAMNKAFLMEVGIPGDNIQVSDLCTMCNPGLFYSHRRSGTKRGTMAAFIGMNKN